MSKLASALDYARQRLQVLALHWIDPDGECSCGRLQCSSAGKHPLSSGWQTLATADEDQIRKLWAQSPQANVGVAAGAASDLTVADIDGDEGAETFRELEKKYGQLPDVPRMITGGKGGQQLYFKHEPGLQNAVRFAPGVDIRNDGGLVVGAGSIVQREYVWEVSSPPLVQRPKMPAWLANLVRSAKASNGSSAFKLPDKIPAGERNSTLYKAARSLKAKQLSQPAALAALKAENAARCQPPLADAELDAIVSHAFEQADSAEFKGPGKPNDIERRGGQATALVELAKSLAVELFHDGDQAYVSTLVGGHLETAAIPSIIYKRSLSAAYFEKTSTSPNSENLSSAMNTLAGMAMSGKQTKVSLRVAERDGFLYLDLANANWDIVEIGRTGWRIVKSQDAPRFRRPRAALALPTPESGGSLELLKRYVNYPTENGENFYLLTVGWLVAALRPTGPYAILLLQGDTGAAKTTAGRTFRSLIDPNQAPLRAEPQ